MYKIVYQTKHKRRVQTDTIESGISTEKEAEQLLQEYVLAFGADWRTNIKLWIEEE